MKSPRVERLVLAALAAFYFLFGLSAYGLLNDNEGLYAETAREILHGGSAIVLHLNGVPYMEKPPLLTWLVAALYGAFGQTALVSRLIPAVSGLVLVAATFAFVARVKNELTGWIAALILATSLPIVMVQRTLMPDGLLVCLFSGAMYLFYLWHSSARQWFLVLSYALLGAAVLTKGFLALALSVPTFILFGALGERSWRYRDLFGPLPLLAFLAIAAPWLVALAWSHPQFAWDYVFNEQVLRYLGMLKPHDYYSGPFYYYLPRIVLSLLPWSAFLPLLLLRRRAAQGTGESLERYCWTWLLVALVFFSASRAKANYYLLIGMPALAIVLAQRIANLLHEGRRWALALPAALLALGIAALDWAVGWVHAAPYRSGLWHITFELRDTLRLELGAAAAFALAAALAFARRRFRLGLVFTGLTPASILVFLVALMQRAGPYVSERDLAQYLQRHHPGVPVFLYQHYAQLSSLPFYLRRTLPVVDSHSADLYFGMHHSNDRAEFLSARAFAALSRREPVALVAVHSSVHDLERRLGQFGLSNERRIGDMTVFWN